MKLRDRYLLLKHDRTYIKGWLHLIFFFILLNYYLKNRNKKFILLFLITLLVSSIYHLISFDSIKYDKCISLLDYISIFITIYIIFKYCNLYKKYENIDVLLCYLMIIMIIILIILYLNIEENHVDIFHLIYGIYGIILVILLLPNIINNKDYLIKIIIPIIIIHIIKIMPINLCYKNIWNNHDIFQIFTVIKNIRHL